MDEIIVWLIVGIAAFFVGRKIFRTITGKTPACSCDQGCSSCGQPKDTTSCGKDK